VVIGDKEINSGKLVVRDRNEGKQREITLQELIGEVKAQTKDKPYLPLNLPQRLSARPQIMV
jgi:threonyl-tRNA synthetase